MPLDKKLTFTLRGQRVCLERNLLLKAVPLEMAQVNLIGATLKMIRNTSQPQDVLVLSLGWHAIFVSNAAIVN